MRAESSPDLRRRDRAEPRVPPPARANDLAARPARARLAMVVDFTPRGDRTLDRFFSAAARALALRGWEVGLTFAGLGPEAYGAELRRTGITVEALSFPFGTRSAVELGRRLLRDRNVVLQAHFLGPFEPRLLALKALGLCRKLQIVDHLSGNLKPLRPTLERVRRLRGAVAGVLVDEYVAVSRFIAGRIVRAGVPAHRVRLIENGVPVDPHAPPSPRPARERPVVVFAGQLIPEKGARVLLEAAQQLAGSAEWILAGAGPAQAELEALAARLGVPARFVGHVDSAELFRRADVVVVPSLWDEAFGLVAVEAMAAGAAVVVSDAGGLPDVVGESGVVVPRGHAPALAAALERLIRSPEERSRLGSAAFRRVTMRFTLERMIAEHVEATEALLRQASGEQVASVSRDR